MKRAGFANIIVILIIFRRARVLARVSSSLKDEEVQLLEVIGTELNDFSMNAQKSLSTLCYCVGGLLKLDRSDC